MYYGLFNIEMDPEDQSIDTGAYDLVIASNVLHGCKDIAHALHNLKKTLQPTGGAPQPLPGHRNLAAAPTPPNTKNLDTRTAAAH